MVCYSPECADSTVQ